MSLDNFSCICTEYTANSMIGIHIPYNNISDNIGNIDDGNNNNINNNKDHIFVGIFFLFSLDCNIDDIYSNGNFS